MEAAFVVPSDAAGVDATDGEVHLGQAPGGVVALLAIEGELADAAAMGFQKPLGLHEHATRAAARVIYPALDATRRVREGFEHFHQHAHDGAGGVEFAAALAL